MGFYSLIILFFGVVGFFGSYSHVIILLMMMEVCMVGLLLGIGWMISNEVGSSLFFFFFFVVMVCEGVMGLSILVCMVRMSGNDYYLSYNYLQC